MFIHKVTDHQCEDTIPDMFGFNAIDELSITDNQPLAIKCGMVELVERFF